MKPVSTCGLLPPGALFDSPPDSKREAMNLLLPTRLWEVIAPHVSKVYRSRSVRSAMLGVIVKYAYERGWNWLEHLSCITVSYSTCRRLDHRLEAMDAWPRLLRTMDQLSDTEGLVATHGVFRLRAGAPGADAA